MSSRLNKKSKEHAKQYILTSGGGGGAAAAPQASRSSLRLVPASRPLLINIGLNLAASPGLCKSSPAAAWCEATIAHLLATYRVPRTGSQVPPVPQ